MEKALKLAHRVLEIGPRIEWAKISEINAFSEAPTPLAVALIASVKETESLKAEVQRYRDDLAWCRRRLELGLRKYVDMMLSNEAHADPARMALNDIMSGELDESESTKALKVIDEALQKLENTRSLSNSVVND